MMMRLPRRVSTGVLVAFFVLLVVGVGQAHAQDAEGRESFLQDAAKTTGGFTADTIENYGKYDEGVTQRFFEGKTGFAEKAAKAKALKNAGVIKTIGKWAGRLLNVIPEVVEIVDAYEEKGAKEATIEAVGGAANVGVNIAAEGTSWAAGTACGTQAAAAGGAFGSAVPVLGTLAGGAIGFAAGFGTCYLLTSKVVSTVADWAENRIEEGLRSIFGREGLSLTAGRDGNYNGDIIISVVVNGAIVTSASGAGSKATANIGVAKAGGTEVITTVNGTVTTIATGRSEARTDIGVASGQGAEVIVNVDGTVTTLASGRSTSTTQIGIASGERSSAIVGVGGAVTTIASGSSNSNTSIGVATGRRSEVVVNADGNITTIASGRANANTEIGGAHGTGASSRTNVKGSVTTIAGGSGNADTLIGVAQSGDVSANVGGSVTTMAAGRGLAKTEIGTGSDSMANVQGSVLTTNTVNNSASTEIARDGAAHVTGNVLNFGGDVSVGGRGKCKYTRNNMCCLTLHLQRCVTKITPSYNGACPPGFIPAYGQCYFIPDWHHGINP